MPANVVKVNDKIEFHIPDRYMPALMLVLKILSEATPKDDKELEKGETGDDLRSPNTSKT